jgi:hypothetical protein
MVGEDGGCVLTPSQGPWVTVPPEVALEMARWILDTFGD